MMSFDKNSRHDQKSLDGFSPSLGLEDLHLVARWLALQPEPIQEEQLV